MRKIKNFESLAVTKAREDGLNIAEAGYWAIDTEKATLDFVKIQNGLLKIANKSYNLEMYERIFVVGIGKCAMQSCQVLEKLLGDFLTDGIVFGLDNELKFNKIRSFKGDHPFPTEHNVSVTKEIIELLEKTTEKDLVIFTISGGGSTLLCSPQEMVCNDERMILQAMFDVGADITEINTVRKHISRARGGHLAKYAYPAEVVSLIFSDIPGNDLEFVASGPTFKDTTLVSDAEKILSHYNILNKCGLSKCGMIETPKEDKYFEKVNNFLVVSDEIAINAMSIKAKELGYNVEIFKNELAGEAILVGDLIVSKLHTTNKNSVLIYSGETIVRNMGKGKGGRNLELALSALRRIAEDELLISIASDGEDNSNFAGAVADKLSFSLAIDAGLDINEELKNHNSYYFFEKIENYLLTGRTGSNVSDLVLAIKE